MTAVAISHKTEATAHMQSCQVLAAGRRGHGSQAGGGGDQWARYHLELMLWPAGIWPHCLSVQSPHPHPRIIPSSPFPS